MPEAHAVSGWGVREYVRRSVLRKVGSGVGDCQSCREDHQQTPIARIFGH